MKILFSSDWHLGYELAGANRQPRLDDQLRNLRRIAAYCEEHAVDVLAVAGDVFEAQERGRARAVVAGMMEALAAPLARGMRMIAIAGNHDRDFFMETASLWLGAHAAPREDRITLVTRPRLLTVEASGERVNVVLLPFPNAARYDLKADDTGAAAQRNERLAMRFVEEMTALQQQAAPMRLPTVLMAHLTVQGSDVGAHRISARDDVTVPMSAFPAFEMTVIGHIHKAERKGSSHFYYVGGLDRMDIGERDYEPRVLLADIGPKGVRTVESLPLDPTPFAEIVVSSEDELHEAAAGLDRAEETLVKLVLHVPYGTYTAPILEAARQLFPRIYGNVEHVWSEGPDVAPSVSTLDAADVRGNVRHYIEENAKSDGERDDLLALADELMLADADGGTR